MRSRARKERGSGAGGIPESHEVKAMGEEAGSARSGDDQPAGVGSGGLNSLPRSQSSPPEGEVMSQVYVSGPVVRHSAQWDLEPWVKSVYDRMENDAVWGRRILLPVVQPELDAKMPLEFFHAIRKRMANATGVVAVFSPGDVPVAIETSIASAEGLKIVLIAEDPGSLPRLLRGLPGVVEEMSPEQFSEKFGGIMDKLTGNQLPPPSGPTTYATPG